jgi:hypothetical protein
MRAGLGIDPLQHPFDHSAGTTLVKNGHVTLVIYRQDRLSVVTDIIKSEIDDRFDLRRERVNGDPTYRSFSESFKLDQATLERLARDKWFRYFYTADEISRIQDRYRSR